MPGNFIDHVKLYLRSGKGGAGAVHFHRARYIPKGGPDGGDGGRGGDIFVKGNAQLSTLLAYRYTRHISAQDGQAGKGQHQAGADGEDITLEVPLGTLILDEEHGKLLAEVTSQEESYLLLKGGRGGRGNAYFKSATRQTPRFAQPGEPGMHCQAIFELKLLAEVGLIGPPNAGKSTLLATISAAKPRIGAYPFTTLTPELGVVALKGQRSLVMADIPGLIQGASVGKGLGIRFLRHAERNRLLVLVIPADDPEPVACYQMLRKELAAHSQALAEKPFIVVLSKADLRAGDRQEALEEALVDRELFYLSAHTQQGLPAFQERLWHLLHTSDR